jgi:aminoglycoside phosphotransferase (APT) family kinase protein
MNLPPKDCDELQGEAERIVTEILGAKASQATRINAGAMTFKYSVDAANGQRFVVRFYPQNRASVVNYEPDVMRLCRERGMRLPEVIASSANGPAAVLEYMVYKMIPGVPMQTRLPSLSQESLSRVCEELIQEVLILNEIKIDGFGDLMDSGRAPFDSWLSFVRGTFVDGLAFARTHSLLPGILLDDIDLIGQHLGRFSYTGAPSLSWGDISPGNIIISEGDEIAGLIDFEGVLSADFQLNLGFLRARYAGSDFYITMADKWPARNDEAAFARSALYVIVRALRLTLYALESLLPAGAERQPLESFLPGLTHAVDDCLRWIGKSSLASHQ